MSELEDKINGILNNPEQLEMIAKMAQSFMGEKGGGDGHGGAGEHGQRGNRENETLAETIAGLFGGNKSQGGNSEASSSSPLGDIDPKMLGMLGKFMGGAGTGGKSHGVITALLPHLSERRREKLERAMKIAKMAKVAEVVFAEGGGDLFGL